MSVAAAYPAVYLRVSTRNTQLCLERRDSTSGVSGATAGYKTLPHRVPRKLYELNRGASGVGPPFRLCSQKEEVSFFSKVKPFLLLLEKISIHTTENREE